MGLAGLHTCNIPYREAPVQAQRACSMQGSSSTWQGVALCHCASSGDASQVSCISMWLAGVYFEKYVKGKLGQTLWIRNLQLSIYGVPLSLAYTYLKDGR